MAARGHEPAKESMLQGQLCQVVREIHPGHCHQYLTYGAAAREGSPSCPLTGNKRGVYFHPPLAVPCTSLSPPSTLCSPCAATGAVTSCLGVHQCSVKVHIACDKAVPTGCTLDPRCWPPVLQRARPWRQCSSSAASPLWTQPNVSVHHIRC